MFSGQISRGRRRVIRADVPGQKLVLEALEKQAFGCGHPALLNAAFLLNSDCF